MKTANPDDQQTKLDRVLEKINEIAKASEDGNYIYRGEHERYEKVSSSLYRAYPHVEGIKFDVVTAQENILAESRAYIGETDDIDETDDIEILTELQHFGGKTNLIDFTEDYLIALFFACDGLHERKKAGRVILLRRKSESEAYKVREPERTINRVESQKSVFIESPSGFVTHDRKVTIPADLKEHILVYLEKHHRISIETIYNDLHGFIRRSASTELLKGVTYQRQASESKTHKEKHEHCENAIKHYDEALKLKRDFDVAYINRGIAYAVKGNFDKAIQDYSKAIDLNPDFAIAYYNRGNAYRKKDEVEKAIQDYSKAITLNPEHANAYNNRGTAYYEKGDFEKAIQDYSKVIDLNPEYVKAYNNRGAVYYEKGEVDKAIQDYDKAIELNPEYTSPYVNRGEAWLHLKEWERAKADLMTAKEKGGDIVASFHNDYESIEDFEAKRGVKMPEDIAALLRGE